MKRYALPLCLMAMSAATLAASVDPLRTGAPAPAFALQSNSGKPLNLADLKGQIVLVNFWASCADPAARKCRCWSSSTGNIAPRA